MCVYELSYPLTKYANIVKSLHYIYLSFLVLHVEAISSLSSSNSRPAVHSGNPESSPSHTNKCSVTVPLTDNLLTRKKQTNQNTTNSRVNNSRLWKLRLACSLVKVLNKLGNIDSRLPSSCGIAFPLNVVSLSPFLQDLLNQENSIQLRVMLLAFLVIIEFLQVFFLYLPMMHHRRGVILVRGTEELCSWIVGAACYYRYSGSWKYFYARGYSSTEATM